jgi:hypothetical protein
VIDSGAVTRVAEGGGTAVSILRRLVERGWRITLPAPVLVECLTGHVGRDADVHRFLNAVGEVAATDEVHARTAAALRFRTGNPSVVDALVAEMAVRMRGPVAVLTTDVKDIAALVEHAPRVRVLGC